MFFCIFKQKTAYEMRISDWSSDVCSSDLDRDDVLVFRTLPLTYDTMLSGSARTEFFVSCDTPDADVTIKLIDEYPPSADYPDGYAMNLAHRSEESRVGKECVGTCRSRGSP